MMDVLWTDFDAKIEELFKVGYDLPLSLHVLAVRKLEDKVQDWKGRLGLDGKRGVPVKPINAKPPEKKPAAVEKNSPAKKPTTHGEVIKIEDDSPEKGNTKKGKPAKSPPPPPPPKPKSPLQSAMPATKTPPQADTQQPQTQTPNKPIKLVIAKSSIKPPPGSPETYSVETYSSQTVPDPDPTVSQNTDPDPPVSRSTRGRGRGRGRRGRGSPRGRTSSPRGRAKRKSNSWMDNPDSDADSIPGTVVTTVKEPAPVKRTRRSTTQPGFYYDYSSEEESVGDNEYIPEELIPAELAENSQQEETAVTLDPASMDEPESRPLKSSDLETLADDVPELDPVPIGGQRPPISDEMETENDTEPVEEKVTEDSEQNQTPPQVTNNNIQTPPTQTENEVVAPKRRGRPKRGSAAARRGRAKKAAPANKQNDAPRDEDVNSTATAPNVDSLSNCTDTFRNGTANTEMPKKLQPSNTSATPNDDPYDSDKTEPAGVSSAEHSEAES